MTPVDLKMPPRSSTGRQDRKSTRLNSSHGYISYAVFCLKKKKNNGTQGKLLVFKLVCLRLVFGREAPACARWPRTLRTKNLASNYSDDLAVEQPDQGNAR